MAHRLALLASLLLPAAALGAGPITGTDGRDRLTDTIDGGKDDDAIDVRGGGRDVVHCSTGKQDRVAADRSDRVAGDCETVSR